MRVRVQICACPGERFGPNAFACQVGKPISIDTRSGPVTGRLVSVLVSPDGRTADLAIALPTGT